MRMIRDPNSRPQCGNTFHTQFEEHIEIKETIVENDHAKLVNRDAADQHPTSAITGLDDTITEINTDISELDTNVTNVNNKVTNLNTTVVGMNSQLTKTLSAEDALTNSEIEQLIGGL